MEQPRQQGYTLTLHIDRDGTPLRRLHIDPRCVRLVSTARGDRVDVVHVLTTAGVEGCQCGDLAQRLTVRG